MSCWSSLPEDLWKLILVHVPLPERLGPCSRVSQKLCRAAAAATDQLELRLGHSAQRTEGIARWLFLNSHQLTSLNLRRLGAPLLELPCQQLRQLYIGDAWVRLGPSSHHLGVLHSCNGLKKLHLCLCEFMDGPNSLSALSAVPALQHLELGRVYGTSTPDQLELPGSVLQMLTQLTFLDLNYTVKVTAESLQHISALQRLQVLYLDEPSEPLSPSSTPGLAQLTGLQAFRLANATLDPAVLQHCKQLRQLKLATVEAASGEELLSLVGQQLQLQQLRLWDMRCKWPTAPSAYTALTASSRLQELAVQLDGLPAGIWQAVFKPQQQLPHLQKLVSASWDASGDNDGVQDPLAVAFNAADLSTLVSCCPRMSGLQIILQADVQLAALSQLAAFTTWVWHT